MVVGGVRGHICLARDTCGLDHQPCASQFEDGRGRIKVVGDEAFCPQCGAARAAGAAFCGGCGRQWDARRASLTRSTEGVSASTWAKRGLILVGLFILSLPGWVVGGYLILKWTGLIRGMSRTNELAAGWAIATFTVVFLAVALVVIAVVGPGGDSDSYHLQLVLIVAAVAGIGVLLYVRTSGAPQFTKNPDWKGFWIGVAVAVVGVSVSVSSYDAAAQGGGSYVIAWGAVLVGGLMVLRSLRRPDPVVRAPLGAEHSER